LVFRTFLPGTEHLNINTAIRTKLFSTGRIDPKEAPTIAIKHASVAQRPSLRFHFNIGKKPSLTKIRKGRNLVFREETSKKIML